MTASPIGRRRLLIAVGAGSSALLAGCNGGGPGVEGEPDYEREPIEDIDAEDRSETELTAADALAEQEIDEGVSALGELSFERHEFVLEDGFRGPTVQGVLENTGDERIDLAEVRVRVYNDDGDQLGRYLDTIGDLDGETTWEFQVIILESPSELAEYDITALGTPN
ncbi:FxLYD domain-containing protein [Natronorubrum daqingense]|uniref:Uncharacterized protein n=1 Tax=Natronorubrum daqingense TaxID=588898 RepID=A0A1N7CWK9_9EURY|nr:FxLYD domain-containing protein [Natronorubrum daqingense]APX97094.1 hypothetical protein BB347_10920 [Natronorubrum daqingense]SIR67920.1 hypothetical protein SAMN05421809_1918 [Natronorubrum daqingense]